MNIKNYMKISFITITLNNNNGLLRTLESYKLFKESYNNSELIVIDGISFDDTTDTLIKYKDLINFCVSEKDYGIYDAMNKGIKFVTGDFVCFMNAGDCILLEGMLNLVNMIDEKKICYIGDASWDFPLKNFKHLNFFPKLLRLPIHQAMLIPIDYCFTFNLRYKIASDLDQKIKIIKSGRYTLTNEQVVLCESGGISQNILSFNDILERSFESFSIAKNHFGYFWGIINFFKFFIWHSFNRLRK